MTSPPCRRCCLQGRPHPSPFAGSGGKGEGNRGKTGAYLEGFGMAMSEYTLPHVASSQNQSAPLTNRTYIRYDASVWRSGGETMRSERGRGMVIAWWREFERERGAARAGRPPPPARPDPDTLTALGVGLAAAGRLVAAGRPRRASDLAFLRRLAADLDAAATTWQADG